MADTESNVARSNIKKVTRRVTKVHIKGFAFADDTFIPANVYQKIGKPTPGTTIDIEVVGSTRGSTKYTAIVPKEKSNVRWENWQIGNDQIKIPNTFPGSDHDGLTFACFKCGEVVCEDSDIWKIKGSCLWTRSVGMVKKGKYFENKFKRTGGFEALCKSCDFIVGSIYPDAFVSTTEEDDDRNRPVPSAKLYITREQQKTFDLLNNLVLTGVETRRAAERALADLSKTDGYIGPRVTAATYDLVRENERLLKEQKINEEHRKMLGEREDKIKEDEEKIKAEEAHYKQKMGIVDKVMRQAYEEGDANIGDVLELAKEFDHQMRQDRVCLVSTSDACIGQTAYCNGYECSADNDPCFACSACYVEYIENKVINFDDFAGDGYSIKCICRKTELEEEKVLRILRDAPDVQQQYNDARRKQIEMQIIPEIEKDVARRLKDELEKKERMSKFEQELEKAAKHIVDDIFTCIKCPG